MKKIILFFMFFLAACVPNYESAPKMKDYSQVPLLELPVQRVNIVSKVGHLERLPHVENLMPLSPEKALKNWALIRLRPNYQKKYKAEFVIEKAENIRQDAPEKSFFVYDNFVYTLSYFVTVRILNEKEQELRRVSLDGFISRKIPQKASVTQLDNMFSHMLYEMEEQLDEQMTLEIKKNLVNMD
jgi:hypothetical protein